jgi:hypothetical protein
VVGVALLVVLGGTGLAVSSPVYSESSPQPVVVQYLQDAAAGTSRWIVVGSRPFPQSFRQAAQFGQEPDTPFPWSPRWRAFVAPAPPLTDPPPELTVVEQTPTPGGGRRLRLRLTSPRGAPEAFVYIPNAVKIESATFEGRPVEFFQLSDYSFLQASTLGPQGAALEVVLGPGAPQDWYVVDQNPGLPPGGEALQKARPATAVAFQDGDITLVSRKVPI